MTLKVSQASLQVLVTPADSETSVRVSQFAVEVLANVPVGQVILTDVGLSAPVANPDIIITDGDRSVYDTVNYADKHARDIATDTLTHHLAPGTAVGDMPAWDGTKWEIGQQNLGHVIQDENTDRPDRTKLSFQGAGVAATDDEANNRTIVTITTPAHTHTESEITDLDHDAAKIQGRNVATDAPSNGQALVWDNAQSRWEPGTVAGTTTFTGLTDTPDSYSGQATKFVRVNAGATGLEFTDAPTGGGGEGGALAKWDPDAVPPSPDSHDDEFLSGTPTTLTAIDTSKWTGWRMPGLTTTDIGEKFSWLTQVTYDQPGNGMRGIYQAGYNYALDGSSPDIWAKVNIVNIEQAGICLWDDPTTIGSTSYMCAIVAEGYWTAEGPAKVRINYGVYNGTGEITVSAETVDIDFVPQWIYLSLHMNAGTASFGYSFDGVSWMSLGSTNISGDFTSPVRAGLIWMYQPKFEFFRFANSENWRSDPLHGDWIEYGGGAGALDDLSDVTLTTPADNSVLAYDSGTSQWIDQTAADAGLATSTHTHTTVPNHDHSGDAGDGSTFDAAVLTSGAATDGHVLTADGSGGAAWEAPASGGHTIEDETTPLTQRANLSFQGAGVTVTDDSGNNRTIVTIPGGGTGGASGTIKRSYTFTVEGNLSVVTGSLRIPNELGETLTIDEVILHATTAPTGAAIICDIHKNGTTIFTTQSNRPQIAAGANAGASSTIEVASWADGDYLTLDVDQVGSTVAGSNLTAVIIATGSAGGVSDTAAHASRPAAGTAGKLFLPSDAYTIERDSGTEWASWGPLYPLTRPVLSQFTWVNQGIATATEEKSGIWLYDAGTAGWNLRVLKKAAPATPYTITIGFLPMLGLNTYPTAGLTFRQSSDGKMHSIEILSNQGYLEIYSSKWASATALDTNYTYNTWFGQACYGGIVWLRIADNGTNRIISYSADGVHFMPYHTIGRTDFLTADEVGFFIGGTAAYPTGMNLLSWKEG